MTTLQANTNATGTTTNIATNKQWTSTAGPIQTKRISKAIRKIRWESTGIKERTGIIGGEEQTRGVNVLMGKTTNPRALEIIAEIGDRYDWTITRCNQKAILTDCQAGLEEAREAIPIHDLRKPQKEIPASNATGIRDYTPPKVAERMIEIAEIEPHQSVLEPSAGIGHLAQAVKASCPNAFLFVCEIASKLREILKVKGFTFASKIHYDCLDLTGQFDRVLMNPPFEKKQDETHIKAMFDRLKPGGRLVAVASVGHFHDSKRDTDGLLDFVEHFGHWEKLPDGSFNGCDAFKNTGVSSVLVVLNK